MKKLIVALVLCVALATAVTELRGGAAKITEIEGNFVCTLFNADSTGFKSGMNKYQIIDASINQKYDYLIASFEIDSFSAAAAGTPGGLGVKDTAVIVMITGTAWDSLIIEQDTCVALPCTISNRYYQSSAETADTSASGTWLHDENTRYGLMHKHLWFNYRMADCTGTADTIAAAINYYIRLFEEED